MRYSVWSNSSHDPAEVLDTATWAEDAGWHGVWYADHYMPNTGDESFKPGPTHECWAMLPAVAAVTERVRVGSLVAPTSVHHPALLANRAVTIDHISHGRMVLGIGAGWQINEHKAYGIPLEPGKQRVDRFEEAIQIMRSLLSEDSTTFHGEYYDITDAPCDPAPVQSPLPILVGTGGSRMLRITARHADEWNTWGNVAGATERRAAFDAACEAVERSTPMWTSVQALIMLSDDRSAIDRAMASPFGSRMIAGSAEQLIDTMGQYSQLGFDEFIVADFNLGESPEERRDSLERINAEIVVPST